MSFDFQDSEVYPVSASATGKNAMHINGCHIVGQSQPYAACLKRIRDYVSGDPLESMRDCTRAIGGTACRAWTMMQEEAKAGKALYFINRDKLQAYVGIIASDRTQARTSDDKPKGIPAGTNIDQIAVTGFYKLSDLPAPKPQPQQFSTSSYADVINQSLAELTEEPANSYADTEPSSLAETLTPAPVVNNAPTRPPMNPGETPLEYSRRLRALMQQEQAQ